MPLYRYANARLESVPKTSLAAEKIRERQDLQRALRESIAIIGDDLLVVAEEYGLFKDSTRRVDLLAIDRTGSLVVIELKRTDDGGHMELQSLRYAAMVSTMTTEQLYSAYAHYNKVDESEAQKAILDWVEDAERVESLADQVRIVLVSADFSTEITSTVLWLNQNYGLDIRCHRITSYRLGDEVVFDIQQIVPLPEAADFQIQQRQKGAERAIKVAGEGRDYTKYDLHIGDRVWTQMSKQMAVKTAVLQLYSAGVPLQVIQAATLPQRWVDVQPVEGESVADAFRRKYPERSTNHLWFDLGITEDGKTWVFPRFGGTDTEPMLKALASAAATIQIDLAFSPSTGAAAVTAVVTVTAEGVVGDGPSTTLPT